MPSAWEHPNSELFFATGAFGVGINLKNFRHFNHIQSWSVEEYLQVAGRVGRDDLPSCQ